MSSFMYIPSYLQADEQRAVQKFDHFWVTWPSDRTAPAPEQSL